jgi:hypothetical protein
MVLVKLLSPTVKTSTQLPSARWATLTWAKPQLGSDVMIEMSLSGTNREQRTVTPLLSQIIRISKVMAQARIRRQSHLGALGQC